jgi:hypothetical protein
MNSNIGQDVNNYDAAAIVLLIISSQHIKPLDLGGILLPLVGTRQFFSLVVFVGQG